MEEEIEMEEEKNRKMKDRGESDHEPAHAWGSTATDHEQLSMAESWQPLSPTLNSNADYQKCQRAGIWE